MHYNIKSKSPINPVAGLWGFNLFFAHLLNHSVKIGHIPIYIGIGGGFIFFELMIRRIIIFHNNLRSNYWWVMNCSIFHKNLQCKYWWLTNNSILQHPLVNAKNKHLNIGFKHKVLRYFLSFISRKHSTRFTMIFPLNSGHQESDGYNHFWRCSVVDVCKL